jgi:hypothetical protein
MNVPAPSEKICRSNGYTCFIEQLSGILEAFVLTPLVPLLMPNQRQFDRWRWDRGTFFS